MTSVLSDHDSTRPTASTPLTLRLSPTRLLVLVLCLWASAGTTWAADLEPAASAAFDRYVADASRRFVRRASEARSSGTTLTAAHVTVPTDGEVVVRPGGEDGIVTVDGGLVHHWSASTLIPGVSLEQVLALSRDYDAYHGIYKPVVASRLLGREGDVYRVRIRLKQSASGISAVLDVTTRVEYFQSEPGSAYAISHAVDIHEIEGAGTPRERSLPAGKDSGYLWRAATFTRFVQRDEGVFVEMETLALSRRFPTMLGWVIEPIARRLGRQSVEQSLIEFRTAVRAKK